jgi:N-methylhydantoinase A/oxoprolinase/acetone carboxylase beta subunit
VDQANEEVLICSVASDMQLPAAAAYEISKLYGLTVRTRTAVINASILPKMLETANSTQSSITAAGIQAPLMIMRGDGGVMTAEEMKRRPILSMLSGPTASVIGALMYLRASDGIYFEVGGTSTNIGVIKNGRPTITYAQLGGYRTYVNSLDVRVLGVAGGSMVRVNLGGKTIVDVGPRSAHIAGMGYAVFQDPSEMDDLKVELFKPKPDDPGDYVCVKMKNGKRVAITNSCAANLLHLVDEGLMPDARWESANKAIGALGAVLGMSAVETATAILTKASDKLVPVVSDLIAEYKLDQDQSSLVGCGGGAGALIPFTANRMNIRYQIPENADVISSIGVALAMVREVVERVIPNPGEKDIAMIRREAVESAIRLGADPSGVEVVIEIDSVKQRVRATAMGATELKTESMMKDCTEAEARKIAAGSMGLPEETLNLSGRTDGMYVYTADIHEKKRFSSSFRRPIRIIDRKGFIKLQHSDSFYTEITASGIDDVIVPLWEKHTTYRGDVPMSPDLFLVVGSHIIEISNVVYKDQVNSIAHAQLVGLAGDEKILIVGVTHA